MIRVAILQHSDLTTPGSAVDLLAAAGVGFFIRHLHRGHPLPAENEYDAVLVLGGGIHVDQEDRAPFLREEKAFLRAALGRRTPILGLCLGAQLLAEALGARVGPHPNGWEVGWHDVECLAVDGIPGFVTTRRRRVSHYHRYVFDLPTGARALARNAWWPCQGFAFENTVALQFHPERTLESNRELALESVLPNGPGLTPSPTEILAPAAGLEAEVRPWFREVLLGALTRPSN